MVLSQHTVLQLVEIYGKHVERIIIPFSVEILKQINISRSQFAFSYFERKY